MSPGRIVLPDMSLPIRETSRLRFGRISRSGSNYFITVCTKHRVPILTQADTGIMLLDVIRAMHRTGDVVMIASTLMPDHAHLLLTLGTNLSIGQVMGKFKTKSRNQGRAPWRWQDDGFEHQLRTHESVEDYGFYIFMNPYRAGLCPLGQAWRWWICPDPIHLKFLRHLDSDPAVPAAWLGLSEEIATRITLRG